ncbi:MAG TPA: hypothetical protein VFH06_02270 [Candidatus Saccharimonadales bacterium]|nr:hypothetical protein [Candidatus Saccharimonadales bacterium]
MKPIANILFNAGYVVHVVEGIGYNRGTVEEAAQKVRHYIAENHLTNCIIVAHSKGGLIGKYLLLHHNKRNVFNGMVAINTPFSGSKYAYLLPLPSLRIFTPNSSLLQQLAVNEVINNRIVSIFGLFDPHIPKGSFLKGATNVRLHTYGHFRTINDKRVHKAILDGLKELSKSKI